MCVCVRALAIDIQNFFEMLELLYYKSVVDLISCSQLV